MDRRARRIVGAFVSALIITGCGPRFDPGTLEASNGTLTPVRSSAPAAAPAVAPGTGVAAATDSAAAVAIPAAAEAGGGGAAASPAGPGSVPAQRGAAVAQAGSKPAAAQAAAGGSGGHGGPSTPERSSTQSGGGPAANPATPVASGVKSEVVLGSIGVEAGILGAVTGPTPPAIRAWAASINARGGLAGHRVRVILADDGNDPARAQALVRQLVERERVVAFISEYTLNTLSAVMPYLEEKKIPVIGSIGGDLIGGASPMMFNPLAGSFGESHAWATLLTINAMTEKKKLGLVYCRVESYRNVGDDADPVHTVARRAAERRQAEAELLAAVSGARRSQAKLLLRLANRYLPLRGVGKVSFLQTLDVARAASRRIGTLLAEQGSLDDPEDVFYLTLTELTGDVPADAGERVTERRELRRRYQGLEIPRCWTGPPEAHPVAAVEMVDSLTGVAASPGMAEGRARVVTDPAETEMEQGDVLIAHTTDPSWASLMFLASALVVDIGGLLSHAAVVARELGIPCVMNTGVGTQVIKTGDLCRVDGSAGTVKIV